MNKLRTAARSSRRGLTAIAVAALMASGLAMVAAGPAAAVTNAVSTTTNVTYAGADAGDGECLHGNTGAGDVVNCNQYADKRDVWLSNLPSTLADGTYFFAVLAPGGQHDPNDGGAGNLSDDKDAATNRAFTQDGGQVTGTSGSHHVWNGKIQLWDYADTPNPGGVYILAVCQGDGASEVSPSDCKYDAFKVGRTTPPPPCEETGACPVTELSALSVLKDAEGSFDHTYTWDVQKSAGQVTWSGSTATIPYDITVTPDSGTSSDYAVTGDITVFNPNPVPIPGVTVTDVLTITRADSTTTNVDCVVTSDDMTGDVAEVGESYYSYTCGSFTLAAGDEVDNTVTAAWTELSPGPGFDYHLAGGDADFTFDDVAFTGTDIDECVALSDVFNGGTSEELDGSLCVGDPVADFTHSMTKQVVVESGCADVTNVAHTVTNDTATPDSSTVPTKLCRPYQAHGARTMGFWQNSNGQAVIGSPGDCTALSTWLQGFKPFDDLNATGCSGVKTYVATVIKNASASGASMNKMLKGQMLATALDVYFTTPGQVTTKAKQFFGATPVNIGAATVDLNPVCFSTCFDARPAFGGAESLTVSQLLTHAAGQSNVGGSIWYANEKSTQEKAKSTFDAINNNKTYAP